MNALIYWLGRMLVALLQALPLVGVARFGRGIGWLAWRLDGKHRRMAEDNLQRAFPEKSAGEVRALARENFLRIAENMLAGIKTAGMTLDQLRPHLTFGEKNPLPPPQPGQRLPNFVFAIGHFGNFELYARFQSLRPDYQLATTYRALNQPGLNRLMQELRNRSGCLYFERRSEGAEMRAAINRGGILLGLLGDQYAVGMRGPFLGRECDTGLAPAVLALRYDCQLYTAFCFRTALAQWRLELGDEIATHENGQPRSTAAIMADVNASYEQAIRRDPANWFWVHNRWKIRRPKK